VRLDHVALTVSDRAACRRPSWQDDGTFVRVQVRDPDGNRVELYAY
jgi:hypothetical protein